VPGGIADRDEVLLGVDEDQAVARPVARRLRNQPAVFGERSVDIIERDAFRRSHAGNCRKTFGRGLVKS